MERDQRLQKLKELLFNEENDHLEDLNKEVSRLSAILDNTDVLTEKVAPIVDDKVQSFTKNELPPIVVSSLQQQINNSQEAVIEALYPIIGKMIKKYIANEISLLRERINTQMKASFSFKNFFKSKFGRSPNVDELIVNSQPVKLLQILIIEKQSGILKAEYSVPSADQSVDQEMIAGMLTAIKSFVEDAFQGKDQNLEAIRYELYTLHIQNFYNYYIAAVISGNYNSQIRDTLENKILEFAQNGISKEDLNTSDLFSNRLKLFFENDIF